MQHYFRSGLRVGTRFDQNFSYIVLAALIGFSTLELTYETTGHCEPNAPSTSRSTTATSTSRSTSNSLVPVTTSTTVVVGICTPHGDHCKLMLCPSFDLLSLLTILPQGIVLLEFQSLLHLLQLAQLHDQVL